MKRQEDGRLLLVVHFGAKAYAKLGAELELVSEFLRGFDCNSKDDVTDR